ALESSRRIRRPRDAGADVHCYADVGPHPRALAPDRQTPPLLRDPDGKQKERGDASLKLALIRREATQVASLCLAAPLAGRVASVSCNSPVKRRDERPPLQRFAFFRWILLDVIDRPANVEMGVEVASAAKHRRCAEILSNPNSRPLRLRSPGR